MINFVVPLAGAVDVEKQAHTHTKINVPAIKLIRLPTETSARRTIPVCMCPLLTVVWRVGGLMRPKKAEMCP